MKIALRLTLLFFLLALLSLALPSFCGCKEIIPLNQIAGNVLYEGPGRTQIAYNYSWFENLLWADQLCIFFLCLGVFSLVLALLLKNSISFTRG